MRRCSGIDCWWRTQLSLQTAFLLRAEKWTRGAWAAEEWVISGAEQVGEVEGVCGGVAQGGVVEDDPEAGGG